MFVERKRVIMICNGVDVEKLTGMVDAVTHDPKLAALKFSVHSEWDGALRAHHSAGQYTVGLTTTQHKQSRTIATDEPPEVLGTDQGITPAETTLAALGSCLMVGYAANAAAMGIELQALSIDLTGEGDLQGFMNLGTVRPGLNKISVSVNIRSDAPRDKIQALHDYVNAHSPIWDTLANPVRIESCLTGDTQRDESPVPLH